MAYNKKYGCNYCGEAFYTLEKLCQHTCSHITKPGEPREICSMCHTRKEPGRQSEWDNHGCASQGRPYEILQVHLGMSLIQQIFTGQGLNPEVIQTCYARYLQEGDPAETILSKKKKVTTKGQSRSRGRGRGQGRGREPRQTPYQEGGRG